MRLGTRAAEPEIVEPMSQEVKRLGKRREGMVVTGAVLCIIVEVRVGKKQNRVQWGKDRDEWHRAQEFCTAVQVKRVRWNISRTGEWTISSTEPK